MQSEGIIIKHLKMYC